MSNRRFAFECLIHVNRGRRRYSRWTKYVEHAKNPYDAYLQLLVRYPGRFPTNIYELNDTNKHVRAFTLKDLIDRKEEIIIEYDLNEET